MEAFADGQLTSAVPDLFYGARPEQVDLKVRRDLGKHIIPSTDKSLPVAPNYFLEAKSHGGRLDVAKRQACHDGAIGARAMHSLRNYGATRPEYDNNAYTVTSTYHGGTLKMYTTHATQSDAPEGGSDYYMTQLNSYALTGNPHTFRQGAAAIRNARDFAQAQRDKFITEANEKARRSRTEVASVNTLTSGRAQCSTTNEAQLVEADAVVDRHPFNDNVASNPATRVSGRRKARNQALEPDGEEAPPDRPDMQNSHARGRAPLPLEPQQAPRRESARQSQRLQASRLYGLRSS